jgi:hypothetical protein
MEWMKISGDTVTLWFRFSSGRTLVKRANAFEHR